jgi:hypothetical protein
MPVKVSDPAARSIVEVSDPAPRGTVEVSDAAALGTGDGEGDRQPPFYPNLATVLVESRVKSVGEQKTPPRDWRQIARYRVVDKIFIQRALEMKWREYYAHKESSLADKGPVNADSDEARTILAEWKLLQTEKAAFLATGDAYITQLEQELAYIGLSHMNRVPGHGPGLRITTDRNS